MVKPADPHRITLQDLITRWGWEWLCSTYSAHSYFISGYLPLYLCSGQGETVVSILTDLSGFWTYENREVLLAENQEIGAG